MPDKFAATWVSHSSISDYLKCPRCYYLNNVYKDPKTGHKITIISPALALGQIVHEVVEALSVLPSQDRFKQPLLDQYHQAWQKVSGIKGGFSSDEQEKTYYDRGAHMIQTILNNPGPLKNLAVKIKMDLPHYWLSEDEQIILCGKIDWLEYFPDSDSVHIIDFKTGKNKEDDNSLQLGIYLLLVKNIQARKIAKASYWYLNSTKEPEEVSLPDANETHEKVLEIAKKVKLARKLSKFSCKKGGCFACKPLEEIVAGKATFVGVNDFKQDMYVLEKSDANSATTEIL